MKLCFVTVGATASFQKLLEQVLHSQFLEILAKHGYTHLLVQYGKDGQQIFQNFVDSDQPDHGITLGGFDFQPSIDAQMMMTVEREALDQKRGLIICHAGMKINIRLSNMDSLIHLPSHRNWDYSGRTSLGRAFDCGP